ncbi:hypothetical protein [Sphingomonas sp. NPDC079357]|jgi:hypothetical protein|uniref:hypothetical protein n=1 Tax=Sphingomonas sp. NPDC079357 TaxID=3364518 RepID=UPI00384E6184
MATFDIIIADAISLAYTEEYPSIEIARDATVRAAIKMMLESPSHKGGRIADCAVVDHDGSQERSFTVALSILDYV